MAGGKTSALGRDLVVVLKRTAVVLEMIGEIGMLEMIEEIDEDRDDSCRAQENNSDETPN